MAQREKLNGFYKGLEKKRKTAVDQFHRDQEAFTEDKREKINKLKKFVEDNTDKMREKNEEKFRLESIKAQLMEKGGEIENSISEAKNQRAEKLDTYS